MRAQKSASWMKVKYGSLVSLCAPLDRRRSGSRRWPCGPCRRAARAARSTGTRACPRPRRCGCGRRGAPCARAPRRARARRAARRRRGTIAASPAASTGTQPWKIDGGIAAQEHGAALLDPAHVGPQRRALAEGLAESRSMQARSSGESAYGSPAKSTVGRRVSRSGWTLPSMVTVPAARVDAVEELAVLEAVLGVAAARLAFELELDDGHGLLHARHQQRVAQALALDGEVRRRDRRRRRCAPASRRARR